MFYADWGSELPRPRRRHVGAGLCFSLLAGLVVCQPLMVFPGITGATRSQVIAAESPMKTVLAADIGKSVQIIGRLGRPLGELVTLRGSWRFPEKIMKDMAPSFRVLSVNGKQLKDPVEFVANGFFYPVVSHVAEIPWDEGKVWEVRGYETGEFRVTPREVARDTPEDPNPGPPQQQPRPFKFGFYTHFVYSRYKLVR
jgi:hypothetical protein